MNLKELEKMISDIEIHIEELEVERQIALDKLDEYINIANQMDLDAREKFEGDLIAKRAGGMLY